MSTTSETGAAAVEEALKHFGVKGMHWGVRRAEKKTARKDKKFEKKVGSLDTFIAVHNGAADHFNKNIEGLNKKYSGTDLTKHENRVQRDAYDREVEDLMRASYKDSANKIKNASGTRSLDLKFHDDGSFDIQTKEIKHAANNVVATGKFKRNKMGHIVSVSISPAAQHDLFEIGEEFIEHFGVKGMRWGVRKDKNTPSILERNRSKHETKIREKRPAIDPRVQDTIGSSKRKKTKLAAKGGEDHPAAADAVRVEAARQKLKKSGVHALSNDELRDVATRANLEIQVKTLESKRPKSLGKQLTEALLADPVGSYETGAKGYKTGKKLFA